MSAETKTKHWHSASHSPSTRSHNTGTHTVTLSKGHNVLQVTVKVPPDSLSFQPRIRESDSCSWLVSSSSTLVSLLHWAVSLSVYPMSPDPPRQTIRSHAAFYSLAPRLGEKFLAEFEGLGTLLALFGQDYVIKAKINSKTTKKCFIANMNSSRVLP